MPSRLACRPSKPSTSLAASWKASQNPSEQAKFIKADRIGTLRGHRRCNSCSIRMEIS